MDLLLALVHQALPPQTNVLFSGSVKIFSNPGGQVPLDSLGRSRDGTPPSGVFQGLPGGSKGKSFLFRFWKSKHADWRSISSFNEMPSGAAPMRCDYLDVVGPGDLPILLQNHCQDVLGTAFVLQGSAKDKHLAGHQRRTGLTEFVLANRKVRYKGHGTY